jgi:predicted esterase
MNRGVNCKKFVNWVLSNDEEGLLLQQQQQQADRCPRNSTIDPNRISVFGFSDGALIVVVILL